MQRPANASKSPGPTAESRSRGVGPQRPPAVWRSAGRGALPGVRPLLGSASTGVASGAVVAAHTSQEVITEALRAAKAHLQQHMPRHSFTQR